MAKTLAELELCIPAIDDIQSRLLLGGTGYWEKRLNSQKFRYPLNLKGLTTLNFQTIRTPKTRMILIKTAMKIGMISRNNLMILTH